MLLSLLAASAASAISCAETMANFQRGATVERQYSKEFLTSLRDIRIAFHDNNQAKKISADHDVDQAFTALTRKFNELSSAASIKRTFFAIDSEPMGVGKLWSTPWLIDVMRTSALSEEHSKFLKLALERKYHGQYGSAYIEALALTNYGKEHSLKQSELLDIESRIFEGDRDCYIVSICERGHVQYQSIKLQGRKSAPAFVEGIKTLQKHYFETNRRYFVEKQADFNMDAQHLMNFFDQFQIENEKSPLVKIIKSLLFTDQYATAGLTDYLKKNLLSQAEIGLLKHLLIRDDEGYFANQFIRNICAMQYKQSDYSPQIQLIDAEIRLKLFSYEKPAATTPKLEAATASQTPSAVALVERAED